MIRHQSTTGIPPPDAFPDLFVCRTSCLDISNRRNVEGRSRRQNVETESIAGKVVERGRVEREVVEWGGIEGGGKSGVGMNRKPLESRRSSRQLAISQGGCRLSKLNERHNSVTVNIQRRADLTEGILNLP
jgi:hypothetical protein